MGEPKPEEDLIAQKREEDEALAHGGCAPAARVRAARRLKKLDADSFMNLMTTLAQCMGVYSMVMARGGPGRARGRMAGRRAG